MAGAPKKTTIHLYWRQEGSDQYIPIGETEFGIEIPLKKDGEVRHIYFAEHGDETYERLKKKQVEFGSIGTSCPRCEQVRQFNTLDEVEAWHAKHYYECEGAE